MTVNICRLYRAWEWWCWLCSECQNRLRREGYTVEVKARVNWPCDECHHREAS